MLGGAKYLMSNRLHGRSHQKLLFEGLVFNGKGNLLDNLGRNPAMNSRQFPIGRHLRQPRVNLPQDHSLARLMGQEYPLLPHLFGHCPVPLPLVIQPKT